MGDDNVEHPLEKITVSEYTFFTKRERKQTSNAAEAVTDQSGVVLFVLFVVFGPISWFLIQSGINDTAAN